MTNEKLSDSMRKLANAGSRERERSAIDSFLMTSATFKTLELATETNSSYAHHDSSFPFPTSTSSTNTSKKPPLHHKQALSLLDEIESSESEKEDRNKKVTHQHPGRQSYSDESTSDDSEGGMIFPSKPSIEIRESREDANQSSKISLLQNGNQEQDHHHEVIDAPIDSFPDAGSKGGGQSDIDQRINALQKFLQKARFDIP